LLFNDKFVLALKNVLKVYPDCMIPHDTDAAEAAAAWYRSTAKITLDSVVLPYNNTQFDYYEIY